MITNVKAFANLTAVCEEIAAGRYEKARELFDMTKEGSYPPRRTISRPPSDGTRRSGRRRLPGP